MNRYIAEIRSFIKGSAFFIQRNDVPEAIKNYLRWRVVMGIFADTDICPVGSTQISLSEDEGRSFNSGAENYPDDLKSIIGEQHFINHDLERKRKKNQISLDLRIIFSGLGRCLICIFL